MCKKIFNDRKINKRIRFSISRRENYKKTLIEKFKEERIWQEQK